MDWIEFANLPEYHDNYYHGTLVNKNISVISKLPYSIVFIKLNNTYVNKSIESFMSKKSLLLYLLKRKEILHTFKKKCWKKYQQVVKSRAQNLFF